MNTVTLDEGPLCSGMPSSVLVTSAMSLFPVEVRLRFWAVGRQHRNFQGIQFAHSTKGICSARRLRPHPGVRPGVACEVPPGPQEPGVEKGNTPPPKTSCTGAGGRVMDVGRPATQAHEALWTWVLNTWPKGLTRAPALPSSARLPSSRQLDKPRPRGTKRLVRSPCPVCQKGPFPTSLTGSVPFPQTPPSLLLP